MTFPEYITVFRQNLFCRLANSRFLYITIKNPDSFMESGFMMWQGFPAGTCVR